MTGKYAVSVEHVFVVLDSPVPCARCKRQTLALFDGKAICSGCAAVWTAQERAGMIEAIRAYNRRQQRSGGTKTAHWWTNIPERHRYQVARSRTRLSAT